MNFILYQKNTKQNMQPSVKNPELNCLVQDDANQKHTSKSPTKSLKNRKKLMAWSKSGLVSNWDSA